MPEHLFKKAKWELFVYKNISEELAKHKEITSVLPGIVLPLFDNKDKYAGSLTDSHHYTTSWHIKYHFEILSRLLNININLNDFHIIPNLVKDTSSNKTYDMSYLIPYYIPTFDVTCSTYYTENNEIKTKYIKLKESYLDIVNVNYLHLQDVNEYEGIRYVETDYHKLFKYSHCCVRLDNPDALYKNKVLISGDSMMIPVIPVLAYYCASVVYLDNRNKKCSNREIWKPLENEFTDVLFSLFLNPTDKYREVNLI